MPVISCQSCGQEFTITDDHAGSSFQCYCGKTVEVPSRGTPRAPVSRPSRVRKRRKKKAFPTELVAAGVFGVVLLVGAGIYLRRSQPAGPTQRAPTKTKQVAKKQTGKSRVSKRRGNLPDSRSDSPDPSIFSDPTQGRQLTPQNSARPSTGTPTTNRQLTPPRGSTWPATGTPKVDPAKPLIQPLSAWKADADPGKFAWSSRSFDAEKFPPAFRIRFPSSPSPFLLISDHVIDENGVAGNNNLAHLMVYDMQKQSVVSKVSKSLAYLNGCDCEVSPNGKRLARIERLHILIWDAATAEELHRIDTIKPDHPGKLQYIEFAGPDRLVSFHGEETVRLYDVQSGKKLNEFQLIFPLKGLGGHPGRKMRVSPGGQFLAILHIRNEAPQKRVLRLHVYDLKSGEHVGNPPIAENLNRLAVQDLVFSDDGEEVAALLYQQRERDFVIVSWNMKQGRQSGFYGPFPSIQTRPFTKERHLVWLKDKSGWVHSGHQLVLRETGKETEIGDPDQGIRHDAQIIGPNTMLQFWETKPRRTARNEMVPVVVKW